MTAMQVRLASVADCPSSSTACYTPGMPSPAPLRIGTRASPLARWQAEWVAARLVERGAAVELVPIATRGDRHQAGPIAAIGGGDGVFTKELQRALLAREIDLGVHSLKDLPTEPVTDLVLGAIPARGPSGDVLVCRAAGSLEDLPPGAAVGTGSLRRRAQLWHQRPDLRMLDLRGNVETRLRKVRQGEFDAIVLAEAGLRRLGLEAQITQRLPPSIMLPAVGQGALAVECRADDASTQAVIAALDDPATHAAVRAERSLLHAIRGGCLAPVAAWGRIEADGLLHLESVVLSGDGRTRLAAAAAARPEEAAAIGRRVAQELLAQGAMELIEACRKPA